MNLINQASTTFTTTITSQNTTECLDCGKNDILIIPLSIGIPCLIIIVILIFGIFCKNKNKIENASIVTPESANLANNPDMDIPLQSINYVNNSVSTNIQNVNCSVPDNTKNLLNNFFNENQNYININR